MSIQRKQLRADVWGALHGQCFYCGVPTLKDGKAFDGRDWILAQPYHQEHMTPVARGGTDEAHNYVPACEKCNREKGSLTRTEFRFLRSLRVGSFDHAFPFEKSNDNINRDWLFCHSAPFERVLMVHNFPESVVAYR